jgi:hypothetical protein
MEHGAMELIITLASSAPQARKFNDALTADPQCFRAGSFIQRMLDSGDSLAIRRNKNVT